MASTLLMLAICFLLLTCSASATDNDSVLIEVGNGTSSTYQTPFCIGFCNSWSEMIYSVDDIVAFGEISSIAWNCAQNETNSSKNTFTSLKIYMEKH